MKAKMEKHVIRGLIAMLAVAVMLGFAPQLSALVYADDGDPDITLGTQQLAKSVNTENAQKLWYGGRCWYVIAYDGKDAAGKAITYQNPQGKTEDLYPAGAVTLFQCDVFEKTRFNDTGDDWNRAGFQNYGADDQGVASDLRTCIETNYLNGDGKTPALLNKKEVAAITSRTLPGYGYDWDDYTDHDKYDSNRINGNDLKNAFVWPLSEAEICSTDGSIKNNAGDYWLRTPGKTSDEIIYVKWGTKVRADGSISKAEGTVYENNVRPAFYLNEKAVLFTSSAYGGKSSGKPGADALKKVGENSDNEWKVTVLDPTRKFTASFEELYSLMTLKIKYENAVTGPNEYISAVIVDKDNNITHYGRVKPCTDPSDASGSFTLCLNNKLKDGCKVYVFNEHMGGDAITDYASKLNEITVPNSPQPGDPSGTMTWSDLKAALKKGGTVKMTNDIRRDSSEFINISSDTTLDLNGFTLDGAGDRYKGKHMVIIPESAGKLTIKDGSQEKTGTVQNVWGADLILVYDGECTLESGILKGSVDVSGSGSFTMAGGTISGSGNSYVLGVDQGIVTMTGGVIDGGGSIHGIDLDSGSLIMKDGEIKKCDTGIHFGGAFGSPSFTMTGGIITECGVGVETSEDGSITIGGNAVIAGNTEKDLWLAYIEGLKSRPQINIGDDLSQEASVGIWIEVIPESPFVVLAEGSKLHQFEKLMFFSNIDGYSVRLNDNELQLFKMESAYPKANPLKVKGKTATVKYNKLKKKSQTLKASRVIKTVQKGQGKLSYKYISAKKGKKSFKEYFKINKKNGKVTVKKGLKRGTYKVTVKVRAAGNEKYQASSWKKVTFKVRIK